MIDKVGPVTVDPTAGIQGYLHYWPDFAAIILLMLVCMYLWNKIPKGVIGVLFVVIVVLFWAFHGGHV